MNNVEFNHPGFDQSGLSAMIEPLANFICAADRPRETLLSALSALRDEVKRTHRAASSHLCNRRCEGVRLVA